MPDLTMPSLGADMDAGTLVAWLVKPGDTVKHGDIVAEVETDKGVIEIESFQEGVIAELVVEPGANVPVGTVLATLEGVDRGIAPATRATPEPAPSPTKPLPSPIPAPTSSGLLASPAARKRASELAIDLSSVSGSGPGGAVVLKDLGQRKEPQKPEDAMRVAIAKAMTASKREIPHYYLAHDIDMKVAQDWLVAHNGDRPVTERVLYAVLLIKAVAKACTKYPEFSGTFDGRHFHQAEQTRVGMAISLSNHGLVAPALPPVADSSVDTVMKDLTDLVVRAREMRLRSSEMSSPTITITNLGDMGTDLVFPIVFRPQVAIVGFGKIRPRPWVVDGEIVPRPILKVTLGADHRVSSGHRGGLFLRAIDRILQHPKKLQ